MSITTYEYNSTISNLIAGRWQLTDYFVGARLLSSAYNHSATHTTYQDISGFGVGPTVLVTGKTITESNGVTTIDCSALDFNVAGTFTAGWVVLHEMSNETTPASNDKLLVAIKLNETTDLDESVTSSIKITPTGLLRIVAANYEAPPQVDVPIEDGTYTITPGKTLADPGAWVDGDVIGVTETNIDPFKLENLTFATGVTIWAPNRTTVTANTGNSVSIGSGGAAVALDNCHGIKFVGFDFTGPEVLYGFLTEDCSDIELEKCNSYSNYRFGIYLRDSDRITLTDVTASNVGQEAIHFGMTRDEPRDSWRLIRCKVWNTGLLVPVGTPPYYGEGLYLGQGSDPNFGPVTNVFVDDFEAYNTRAEGIDCKSNVQTATFNNIHLHDIILPYNGAMTVGSENEQGFDSTITITNLRTSNITTSGNEYNPFAHLVIGRGNVTVEDFQLGCGSGDNEYGISLFKTCVNQAFNDAYIGRGTFGDCQSINRISINEFNANLGAVDNPMDYFVKPTDDNLPILWLDASDSSTLTLSGDNVTEWRDKSGLNYHAEQSDTNAHGRINQRTINNVQVIDFSGSDNYYITNGPQLLNDSMIFAVIDSDATAFNRWLLSFQEGNVEKIGMGVDANGFWFVHGEANATKLSITAASGGILLAGYKTGSTQYFTDGDTIVTDSNGELQRALTKWFIGSVDYSGGPARYFDGAIAEIKVYDFYSASLFASERVALSAKWGL